MPASRRNQQLIVTPEEAERWRARIVTGPEPERFYCPHPGCNRSFAELWRLKVHYRAPPDVRGSGKERGHGTELSFCPKCGKDLHPGKHHVGCVAGKSAPRQAAKRQRQILQASTTIEEPLTLTTTTTSSIEQAIQRRQAAAAAVASAPPAKAQRVSESEGSVRKGAGAADSCRLDQRQRGLESGELQFPTTSGSADGLVPTLMGSVGLGRGFVTSRPLQQVPESSGVAPGPRMASPGGSLSELFMPHTELPSTSDLLMRPHSPPGGGPGVVDSLPRPLSPFGGPLLRAPSPPPLPPEWGGGAGGAMLFDFDQARRGCMFRQRAHVACSSARCSAVGRASCLRAHGCPCCSACVLGAQGRRRVARSDRSPAPRACSDLTAIPRPLQFDVNKRQQHDAAVSAPLVTVTTAMQPHELHHPSDDYIWQILFAGENDPVPKRVTAHLHHPPELDDPLLWADDLHAWPEPVAPLPGAGAPAGAMQPPPPRPPSGGGTQQGGAAAQHPVGGGEPAGHAPPEDACILEEVLSLLEPKAEPAAGAPLLQQPQAHAQCLNGTPVLPSCGPLQQMAVVESVKREAVLASGATSWSHGAMR
eukprot:scaffold1.g5318.t1